MKLKYFIALFTTIVFTGCGSTTDDTQNQDNDLIQWQNNLTQYVYPNLSVQKYYDYYEIVDGNITYTHINMDDLNLISYFSIDTPSYNNTLYDINSSYPIVNPALDINRTEDCMIINSYDTLTKVHQKDVYIKDYGLYETSKNYCVNTNNSNCTAYLYVRY